MHDTSSVPLDILIPCQLQLLNCPLSTACTARVQSSFLVNVECDQQVQLHQQAIAAS